MGQCIVSSSLKQSVCNKADSYFINDDQLENLQSILGRVEPSPSHPGRIRYAWAISVLIIVVFFGGVGISWIQQAQKDEMSHLIAQEVVGNHLNMKPLEVRASTIAGVKEYFTQLDFVPVDSELLKGKSITLIGARYCSIQGKIAAQLRYQQASSSGLDTLYQTEYRQDVFGYLPDVSKGEEPAIEYAKGVGVTIWVEKGILFALTSTPSNNY